MSMRKRLLSVLAVLLLASALAYIAAAYGGSGGGSSESLFSRKATINLWYTDDSLTDFLNDVCVAYTDSQSEYRVEPTLIDDTDYMQKLYDASKEGEEFPDVFTAGNDLLERLWLTGLAAQVTDTDHFGNTDTFCEPALDAVTYQDMVIAYPLSYEAAAFLYNADYLQDMADTAGKTLEETVPGTMVDVITLANSYDAPEEVTSVLKWDVSDIFYNYCFVGNYLDIGGQYGDDTSQLHVYNQQLISCLQVYQQLNQFFSIDSSSVDYDSLIQDFAAGKIVFTLATSDSVRKIAQYEKANGTTVNYGVTQIPDLTGDLKSKTLSITNCLVINGYSEQQEAANAFVQYLLFEGMDSFYDQTGKAPALAGSSCSDAHMDGFYAAYEDSAPITKLRAASNFWMLLESTFSTVWDGEDPNEQLRQLCQQLLIQMTGQENVQVSSIADPVYVDIQSELSGGE